MLHLYRCRQAMPPSSAILLYWFMRLLRLCVYVSVKFTRVWKVKLHGKLTFDSQRTNVIIAV